MRGAVFGALAATAVLVATVADDGSGYATGFTTAGGFTVADVTADANSDIIIKFELGAADSIFSAVIAFLPGDWGIAGCPANDMASATRECADLGLADGTLTGRVESEVTLSLLNAACVTVLPLTFDLMDATTDMSTTVVFDDDPDDPDDAGEQFEDDDADGVPNGAEMYPEYLTRLVRTLPFGADGSEVVQPIARSYSQITVADTADNVSLQFLVLEPGGMINGMPLDLSLGFPVVLVLNDIGDPGRTAVPDPVTGLCTPMSSVGTTFGITQDNLDTAADESGLMNLTNPSVGGYFMTLFLISESDADNDGIENPLDTCPTQGNSAGWNPHAPTSPGDDDADGIPNVCDPMPNVNTGPFDHDGDTFLNRADNCPLVANPSQLDSDSDDIGDACDPDPLAMTGHSHIACVVEEVDIGSGGDPAEPHPLAVPPCVLKQFVPLGDVDCSGTVDAVDVLLILRFVASIQPTPGCIDVADLQCDGDMDAVDALQGLRFLAGFPVSQEPGCPGIGAPV